MEQVRNEARQKLISAVGEWFTNHLLYPDGDDNMHPDGGYPYFRKDLSDVQNISEPGFFAKHKPEIFNLWKRDFASKGNNPTRTLKLLLEKASNEKKEFKRIAVPCLDGFLFIKVEDIIYLEASSNYTKFYMTDNRKYIASKSMKDFEEMLPNDTFIRIHNSFIINKEFVEKYIRGEGGQVVLYGNITLDISKRKKGDFLKAIEN